MWSEKHERDSRHNWQGTMKWQITCSDLPHLVKLIEQGYD